MKLVDTSVWINYLNGRQGKIYDDLFNEIIDGTVVTCPVIIQEVLQGTKSDKEFENVKDTFLGLEILYLDPVSAAIGASLLFRKLKSSGITIRKPNDCLIAFYAIQLNIPILYADQDFDHIAKLTTLKIINATV